MLYINAVNVEVVCNGEVACFQKEHVCTCAQEHSLKMHVLIKRSIIVRPVSYHKLGMFFAIFSKDTVV